MKWYVPTGIAAAIGGLLVYGAKKAFGGSLAADWLHAGPPLAKTHVTSGWWDPRPYRNGFHEGFDLRAAIGTPVRSILAGKVILVDEQDNSNAGKWLAILHGDGLVSEYMHLSRIDVKNGQTVKQGQQIALSGNTGAAKSGPHLHMTLRIKPRYLAAYQHRFGRPTTGWGTTNERGIAIPAEPIIPAHTYAQTVLDQAKKNGIRYVAMILR